MGIYKLNEVFGVSPNPVLSYVERDLIDNKFNDSLDTGNHIVVYGASKQGKTALVSRHLSYDENIVVRLTPSTSISDIYASVLRQAGIEIDVSGVEETGSSGTATFGIKAKAKLFFLGEGEASATGAITGTTKTTNSFQYVPFNLAVAQDVSELLKKVEFNKKIILENFHYLDEEKQKELSFDLRTFQEVGIIFIILGVWRKKDKLRIYCNDLTDRLDDLPVEPWKEADFRQVIQKGSDKLNIEISEAIILTLMENSFGSVGVLQELLKELCELAGVSITQQTKFVVDDHNLAIQALQRKCEEYRETHQQSLELLASGNITHSKNKDKIPLHLPYYLVRTILQLGYEGIKSGASRPLITEKIKKIHHRPEDVRASDMSNLLHNLSGLQFKKGLNPPLIDYDRGKRELLAIDSTFFYFLKNTDLAEFEEELPTPIE
ncbi:hypothetical protein AAFZ98_001159 [Vibrio parahaemolyticus]